MSEQKLTEPQKILAAENMGLIHHFAHIKIRTKQLAPSDIDEAMGFLTMAYLTACQQFDPDRTTTEGQPIKFVTFCWHKLRGGWSYWMRDKTRRPFQLLDDSKTVHQYHSSHKFKPSRKHIEERLFVFLTPRQRLMMKMRYFEGLTLQQVADKTGYTKERVRQLCREARFILTKLVKDQVIENYLVVDWDYARLTPKP